MLCWHCEKREVSTKGCVCFVMSNSERVFCDVCSQQWRAGIITFEELEHSARRKVEDRSSLEGMARATGQILRTVYC